MEGNKMMWAYIQAHKQVKIREVYKNKKGERLYPLIEEWAEVWLRNESTKILSSYLNKKLAENGKVIPPENMELVKHILKDRQNDS